MNSTSQSRNESTDSMPMCPNCGSTEGFETHRHFHYESTGEVFDDVWLTCNSCGKKTSLEEIE